MSLKQAGDRRQQEANIHPPRLRLCLRGGRQGRVRKLVLGAEAIGPCIRWHPPLTVGRYRAR
jgi:hypothetical protein